MYRDDISPPSGGGGGRDDIDRVLDELRDIGVYTDIDEFEKAVEKDPVLKGQLDKFLGRGNNDSGSNKSSSSKSRDSSSEGGYDGDSGGGGCFIATAVYGEDSWQVAVLRRFRDECLLTNIIGRMFVKLYYATSPPIANFLRRRTTLCKIVRMLLNPICKIVKKIIY